jgi:predicted Zn-dependent protease with MMP-like domain
MNRPRLSLREFSAIIDNVVRNLPEPFRAHLENVAVDVEQRPSARTLRQLGLAPHEWDELMGLFEGAALTEQNFGEHHPNRIVLYKQSIEAACRSRAEIEYEIRRTVIHELAHHFGYSEEQLEEFEAAPSPFDHEHTEDAS